MRLRDGHARRLLEAAAHDVIDAATRRRFLERVLVFERAGVGRDAARAAASREIGIPLAAFDEADANILEKQEQVEIRRIAIAYGFKVRNMSQYRASKVAEGIGDLILTHSRFPIMLWWESKRQVGGARSEKQVEFGDDCVRCKTPYGFGDRYAFVDKLLELEVAVRGSGQYGIEPVRHLTSTQ